MPEEDEKITPTPGHMVMQELSARSYQHYLASLKKGAKSGISEEFGSAADIFGSDIARCEEKFDPTQFEPKERSERKARMAYLASLVKQDSFDFLEKHISCWLQGGYDSAKPTRERPGAEYFNTVWKAISATVILMIAVEQIDEGAPEWLKSYLWGCLSNTEQLAEKPTVDDLLNVLLADGMELSTVCRNGTSSICATLGFGLVGEPAWSAVQDFLASVPRIEYLKKSLLSPLVEISEFNATK